MRLGRKRFTGPVEIKDLPDGQKRLSPCMWWLGFFALPIALGCIFFISGSTVGSQIGLLQPIALFLLVTVIVGGLIEQIRDSWRLEWNSEKALVTESWWPRLANPTRTFLVPDDTRIELTQRSRERLGRKSCWIDVDLISECAGMHLRLARRPELDEPTLTREAYLEAVDIARRYALEFDLNLIEGGVSLLQPKLRVPDGD